MIAELLARARSGDAAAVDELFGACRNYLQLVARSQLESGLQARADASDLVQQTLLDAHRDFAAFRGRTEGELLGWMRVMLCRNAVDIVRAQRKGGVREVSRDAFASDARPPEPIDPGLSPSQWVARHERELALANAVALLSPEHREVIVLRNLERLPFDEIGRRMDRSRPAVQMLWMRALQQLEMRLTPS
jgi:RNA polymerase sigma-70 factor (ECF subfamily)